MPKQLSVLKWKVPPSCDCGTCRSMCKNPCYPTPEEAEKLIELGFGPQMMLTSRLHPKKDYEIFVICPAARGLETKSAWDSRAKRGSFRCIFQKEGLCQLHNVCKPLEGRLAICQGPEPINLRDQVTLLWDNVPAKKIVYQWIQKFAKNKEALSTYFTSDGLRVSKS